MKKQLIAFTILTSFIAANTTYPAFSPYQDYAQYRKAIKQITSLQEQKLNLEEQKIDLMDQKATLLEWAKMNNKENDPEVVKKMQQIEEEIQRLDEEIE